MVKNSNIDQPHIRIWCNHPFSLYEQYTFVIKMSDGHLVTMIYGLLPAFFLIEDKLFLATSLHKIFHKIKDVKCFTISHTYDCLLYGI